MRTIYLLLCLCSVGLSAQTLEERIANELCVCLGNKKAETEEQLQKVTEECMLNSMQTHLKELYTLSEVQENEFWDAVMGLMVKKCGDNLMKNFVDIKKEEEKPAVLECEDIKIGNYYYNIGNERDYLTFTPNQVIENRGGGIYTFSKIEWVDKCVYKLTMQESNSRFDAVHMKNNPYTFKVIENTPDYFIVQTQYIENMGIQNVKVYKLPYKTANIEVGTITAE